MASSRWEHEASLTPQRGPQAAAALNTYHHLLYTSPAEAERLHREQPADFLQLASIAENFGVLPQQVRAGGATEE